MPADADRVQFIADAFPAEGLFQDKEWLRSPDAFPIDQKMVDELTLLGRALHAFNRACNRLYRESARGNQPAWIAQLLDRGKPRSLIDFSLKDRFAEALPSVIRPDIILGEDGLYVTELDSLPGGIGVTAWMNKTYSHFDDKVIGGRFQMIDQFARLLNAGDIIISREAQDYKPEMLWITREIRERHASGKGYRVINTWDLSWEDLPERAYRYFELWDLENVESADRLMSLAEVGAIDFTPPFKPYMEEKLWLALFWSIPLRSYWEEAVGREYCEFLRARIPYGWVVDPTPIPAIGEIPKLHITSWSELGEASQKDRRLVLKISGFSREGWGSRGVHIGHDLSGQEWRRHLDAACKAFDSHPYILQVFHKGRLVNHRHWDGNSSSMKEMHGRVRLCPYYLIQDGDAKLSGVMATICPSDKKLIHGMKDAIIVPCTVSSNSPA